MIELTTADAVLAMAIDMEQTGKEFYEALALGCGNSQVAALCNRLALAETQHANVFATMRRRLPQDGQPLPLTEEQSIRAHDLVKDFVIPNPETVHKVGMGGKLRDALDMAIQMEKDSVTFYETVVRDVQSSEAGAVKRIIDEEREHLRSLKAQVI
jgi:rubrerythrin